MEDGSTVVTPAAAMRLLRWTMPQLWVAFVAAGGQRTLGDVEAHVRLGGGLGDAQGDVLAAALNDALMDHGQAARVAYHDQEGGAAVDEGGDRP